jgi:uncharacterized membrane protein
MIPVAMPRPGDLTRSAAWMGWGALILGTASLIAGQAGNSLPLPTPYKRHLAAAMLQFSLATLAAGCLSAWCVSFPSALRWIPALSDRTARLLAGGGAVAYATGLAALSLVRHRALLTGIWDLGYYAQLTWQLAHAQLPRSSVWHDAPWGNHATFILVAVAPFLGLAPDPATLLVLQSLALSLGAIPTYMLGRRVWGTPHAGLAVAVAYLLYPPLQFANLFDFHADTFATPLLLAAFAALFAGRVGWAVAWAALLIFVKEDIALVAACFGLYVAITQRRAAGLILTGVAAVAFGLLVWIVIPGWIQTPYLALFNRWPDLGRTPLELVLSPVLQPAVFFGTLLQPERLGYLALLVVPLAGLPLLAPEVLAVGLLPLASNFLSSVEAQYTIRAHYTAALTPILVVATVVGGFRLGTWLERTGVSRRSVLAALIAASSVASLAFSPMPWSWDAFARKQFWNAAPRVGLPRLASVVPPDASVSAANHLGAHFALRPTLRLFPDGWETADLVLVDVSGREYVGAQQNPDAFPPLLHALVETKRLLLIEDGLAVFGRGTPSSDTATRLTALRAEPVLGAQAAGDLSLVVVHLTPGEIAPREKLQVQYTWMAPRNGTGMPCVMEVLARVGRSPALQRTRLAFYGLLAGNRWPAGMIADEIVSASVPETTPPGLYTWSVTTWYDPDHGLCRRPPDDATPLVVARIRVHPW